MPHCAIRDLALRWRKKMKKRGCSLRLFSPHPRPIPPAPRLTFRSLYSVSSSTKARTPALTFGAKPYFNSQCLLERRSTIKEARGASHVLNAPFTRHPNVYLDGSQQCQFATDPIDGGTDSMSSDYFQRLIQHLTFHSNVREVHFLYVHIFSSEMWTKHKQNHSSTDRTWDLPHVRRNDNFCTRRIFLSLFETVTNHVHTEWLVRN